MLVWLLNCVYCYVGRFGLVCCLLVCLRWFMLFVFAFLILFVVPFAIAGV